MSKRWTLLWLTKLLGLAACTNDGGDGGDSSGRMDAATGGDGGADRDALVQYTPDQASWGTFATKPFAGGTNTSHDPALLGVDDRVRRELRMRARSADPDAWVELQKERTPEPGWLKRAERKAGRELAEIGRARVAERTRGNAAPADRARLDALVT